MAKRRAAPARPAGKATRAKAAKIDLFKARPVYFSAKTMPALETLAAVKYLSISGVGSPDSKRFSAAVEALYSVAYTLKFQKKPEGQDFKVSTLEGLWWTEPGLSGFEEPDAFMTVPKDEWRWKLLIMVPDFIRASDVSRAKKAGMTKKPKASIAEVGLERINEGTVVQLLHVGPYATEPASIRKMHDLMVGAGFRRTGVHHEIYLSDPRRVKPDRLKTILRQPVTRA